MKNRYLAVLLVLALALVASFVSSAKATQYGTSTSGGLQTFTGSAAGSVTLAAPSTGSRLALYDFIISSSGAGVHTLRDGTTSIFNVYLAANTPLHVTPETLGGAGILLTASTALTISSSNTITFVGRCASQ